MKKKLMIVIGILILISAILGKMYYDRNTLENKIEIEIAKIIKNETKHKYFTEEAYDKIRQFIDKSILTGYTNPKAQAFKIPDSESVSVLIRATDDSAEDGEAISYMTLSINSDGMVDSVIISSWITISKEKSNF